jgi:hypothetical protein
LTKGAQCSPVTNRTLIFRRESSNLMSSGASTIAHRVMARLRPFQMRHVPHDLRSLVRPRSRVKRVVLRHPCQFLRPQSAPCAGIGASGRTLSILYAAYRLPPFQRFAKRKQPGRHIETLLWKAPCAETIWLRYTNCRVTKCRGFVFQRAARARDFGTPQEVRERSIQSLASESRSNRSDATWLHRPSCLLHQL